MQGPGAVGSSCAFGEQHRQQQTRTRGKSWRRCNKKTMPSLNGVSHSPGTRSPRCRQSIHPTSGMHWPTRHARGSTSSLAHQHSRVCARLADVYLGCRAVAVSVSGAKACFRHSARDQRSERGLWDSVLQTTRTYRESFDTTDAYCKGNSLSKASRSGSRQQLAARCRTRGAAADANVRAAWSVKQTSEWAFKVPRTNRCKGVAEE